MPNLPGPIKVTFTVKEAAAIHVILDALVRVHDKEPDSFPVHDMDLLKRSMKAIEADLKKTGCILDQEGWHT